MPTAASKAPPKPDPAPKPTAPVEEPKPSTTLATLPLPAGSSIWASREALEVAKEGAQILAHGSLVPEAYRNNPPNCLIVLEIAVRMGLSPLMMMNVIDIIRGRPALRSQYIIATINASGKFKGMLRFKMTGDIGSNNRACQAFATEKSTGELVEGPAVTIQMAKIAGWFDRDGSHWKVNPELMLQYRAAAFFGRLYVPERLMGLHSVEEVHDIIDVDKEGNVLPPQTGVAGAKELLAG